MNPVADTTYPEAIRLISDAKKSAVQVSGVLVVAITTIMGFTLSRESWGLWLPAIAATLTALRAWTLIGSALGPMIDLIDRVEDALEIEHDLRIGKPIKHHVGRTSEGVIFMVIVFLVAQILAVIYTGFVIDWTFAGK